MTTVPLARSEPQADVELDQDLAVDRDVQVADVDDAGALGAAGAVGVADVGPDRVSDEGERARRECRYRVKGVQIVEYPEIR